MPVCWFAALISQKSAGQNELLYLLSMTHICHMYKLSTNKQNVCYLGSI